MNSGTESYLKVDDCVLFSCNRFTDSETSTLLLLHGMGDSGLAFREVFESPDFKEWNLLVPDFPGYGRSSSSKDYSFQIQIARLWRLIEHFQIRSFVVVGHSMGGVLATLLCQSDQNARISKLVNIEGNLTPADLFFSNAAVAAQASGRFLEWFNESFRKEEIYHHLGSCYESCRRYFASLSFSRPEAFLANAKELVSLTAANNGDTEIGELYSSVSIPKVYFYGTKSVTSESLRYLERKGLQSKGLAGCFHWPMIERQKEFYTLLHNFVR